MYNKIASIILNSAKANGLSDVFVAQPDSLRESSAGKIFVLAELSGKKSEGRKIFDFLITALEDNYYNDEKILFRDKIEGLKIENIFEAAIAKTNKNFVDFLASEKIRINPTSNNITLGVIYENNLHFSTFGNNRALLLYKHNEEYEIINVETNATDLETEVLEADASQIKKSIPKLFSSVISGEIPLNSYFIFTNEALPEYLSGREMLKIITKLPPMVAAEQIKNVLTKINTYVPFLGIIIKNTIGLANQEFNEKIEENLSAHNSISSLNYTEAKTEQMLSPSGLISLSKFFKNIKKLVKKYFIILFALEKENKKEINKSKKINKSIDKETTPLSESDLNLGKIKSLNLARSDAFLIKEKIFFKKKIGWIHISFNKIIVALRALFSSKTWLDLFKHLRSWAKGLNTKNRWLFLALGALIVIFVASLFLTSWNHKRQVAQTKFNNLVANIKEQEDSIDTHLLYHDENGAKQIFIKTQALLSSFPQKTKEQQIVYKDLALKLQLDQDKIEKIINLKSPTKINDLNKLDLTNIIYTNGKIYAAKGSTIYSINPGETTYTKITIPGNNNLIKPAVYNNNLYYWDNDKLFIYNIKTGHNSISSIADLSPTNAVTSFKIFYGNLYLLVDGQNQVYRYLANNKFKVKTNWLKEKIDLSSASDLAIDGHIYILKKNGQVLKFYVGRPITYSSVPLSPVMVNANKLVVGNQNIYVFEAGSQRLAVLAKSDGHLLNQYQFKSIINPKDFTVDEANKVAYILNSEGIYKIPLKQ